jgi:hypothetical protein
MGKARLKKVAGAFGMPTVSRAKLNFYLAVTRGYELNGNRGFIHSCGNVSKKC